MTTRTTANGAIQSLISVRTQQSAFGRALAEEIAGLWVLDAHEHLEEEPERAALAQDCFYLTSHYCNADLLSAGMPKEHVDGLLDRTIPLDQRWASFAPDWEYARTTGYGQAVNLAGREVFGVDELTADTYQTLSQRVAASAGQPGWYEHILKDKARFIGCVLDGWRREADPRHFFLVLRFDPMITARTPQQIRDLWECREREIGSLADYLAAMDAAMDAYVRMGVVALKCGLAYRRTLRFERVPRADAERLFARALRDDLPDADATPLQDYLFHEVCDRAGRAGAHGLPYQIHTGLQAGNWGAQIQNTNPALLTNTLHDHPQTRFDLFHGGYPYGGELATLAKNFPNTYVNACWLAIIAPTVLRRMLHEWLDTVPHNKIQAFGGDYRHVELAYAHSLMARAAVADVLAERVEQRLLDEHDAPLLARRLLADNGLALYTIPPDRVAEMTAPAAGTAGAATPIAATSRR